MAHYSMGWIPLWARLAAVAPRTLNTVTHASGLSSLVKKVGGLGCCGLAGNFGFEAGHYDVSVACAEDKLMPALRDADPDTLVLAAGFNCRTQIRDLAHDCRPMHLAQVLAGALDPRA